MKKPKTLKFISATAIKNRKTLKPQIQIVLHKTSKPHKTSHSDGFTQNLIAFIFKISSFVTIYTAPIAAPLLCPLCQKSINLAVKHLKPVVASLFPCLEGSARYCMVEDKFM